MTLKQLKERTKVRRVSTCTYIVEVTYRGQVYS